MRSIILYLEFLGCRNLTNSFEKLNISGGGGFQLIMRLPQLRNRLELALTKNIPQNNDLASCPVGVNTRNQNFGRFEKSILRLTRLSLAGTWTELASIQIINLVKVC